MGKNLGSLLKRLADGKEVGLGLGLGFEGAGCDERNGERGGSCSDGEEIAVFVFIVIVVEVDESLHLRQG